MYVGGFVMIRLMFELLGFVQRVRRTMLINAFMYYVRTQLVGTCRLVLF